MTFSGLIELEDKLALIDLDKDEIVNPFLYLFLSQIDFNAVLVQNNQFFLPSFGKHIILLPSSPATHLPGSLYNYMED